jgi:putative Mg2+ transporter-C (MgtC) family protein
MFAALDWSAFVDDVIRLTVAAVLGGVLGFEREYHGHWAGLRTHMMVAVGAAVFTMCGLLITTDSPEHLTRVIQGVATGIGFLGAGTILKLGDEVRIKGLTTASSIWLAAALGTCAGMGNYALAAATLCVGFFVLVVLRPLEKSLLTRSSRRGSSDDA